MNVDTITIPTMSKPTIISMRVSEDLKNSIQDKAEEEGMSITGFVLFCIAQYTPELKDAVLRNSVVSDKNKSLAETLVDIAQGEHDAQGGL